MYKIDISELAYSDLDRIVSYTTLILDNPIAATSFLDEVEQCYEYLKNTPYMYTRCRSNLLGKEDYRKIPIKNYILVYRVDEEEKTVNILRFFYGAQNYLELI